MGSHRVRHRHWAWWPIGSPDWWRDVRKLGVQRQRIEAAFGAAADAIDWQAIDPHGLPPSSPAENAVMHVLLAWNAPSYAALMYVTHSFGRGGRTLKEWIVRQYTTLIEDGDAAVRKATWYALGVDYFERPDRARWVFPRLHAKVRKRSDELLAEAGAVPWDVKREAYLAAARDPKMHEALAKGLQHSFSDVTPEGGREIRDLARTLLVEDEHVRTELEQLMTRPTRWRVLAVITVDTRDPRWTTWLPENAEPSFLLLLQAIGEHPPWRASSEVIRGGLRLGRLVHCAFPFDRAVSHRVYGTFEDEGPPRATLFRIEGDVVRAREAIGLEVDVWPAGLAPVS